MKTAIRFLVFGAIALWLFFIMYAFFMALMMGIPFPDKTSDLNVFIGYVLVFILLASCFWVLVIREDWPNKFIETLKEIMPS